MEKVTSDYVSLDDCEKRVRAIDDTMDILNGKWKISILSRLLYKPLRYSELLKAVSGISGKMLSRELQELEMNGLIKRTVASTKPLSVSYEVTAYGLSLKVVADSIADWGLKHRAQITKSSKFVVEDEVKAQ
ncbi:winged helix-turn-helix transcriptional regulator [Mucilaginibacter lappiensis]|uniref:DNA-binding HxlR family transcriptional regulator n=1 Tax=Mucilaginibacter lappiensis TaxID=354630 RepID=A0A841JK16_9SPHI|nr:helix-turn-helix domain-containing protein [Mucilaginibacter lappiensis]MBB6130622.1 DNA-binding HxlR family transcriptional regulator [Mucilaginibacter lappiensis]